MEKDDPPIVGYFCWVRTMSGEPAYEKRDKLIYDGKQPDTRKILAGQTHCCYNLTAADWDMPLEVLAKRFPLMKVLSDEEFQERLEQGVFK